MSWLSAAWREYHSHRADLTPVLQLTAGLAVAGVALARHFAQTEADRQRRITESFSKATEQLGSDKIEVRLGGIYTLERISRESKDDYWTVMETLCAFVRERARWKAPDTGSSETVAHFYEKTETTRSQTQPSTDIAAVLAVIVRREHKNQRRESNKGWKLVLRETDLSGGADLRRAGLSRADLSRSNLDDADLVKAKLSGADLSGACLGDARLVGAKLSVADLSRAYLGGANLTRADVSGADLKTASGLSNDQLAQARGDAKTRLPAEIQRPAQWPPETPDAEGD
jgi:hypothetical protein